jgi:hypothetical protein
MIDMTPNRAVSAFACELCWCGRRGFFISWSNDHDGVAVDGAGSIRLFDSLDSLSRFILAEGLTLTEKDSSFWDFDSVLAWCTDPRPPVDCSKLLNAWNMLDDIHASRGRTNDLLSHADQQGRAVYDKLFYGCNLPSMTPEGQSFNPSWSAEECRSLAQLLRLGLAELEAALPSRSKAG